MAKNILVTGATGKQGSAVVEQLANQSAFTVLAVTRNASSPSAEKLKMKGSNIKVVQGNLDDTATLFKTAQEVGNGPVWGCFSVQVAAGQPRAGVTKEIEIKQGSDMVDEAVKAGVKHFVYSSVERGGEEKSWTTPTPVPHFQTKHQIEQHLRDNAGGMGWTILRPAAFMDNLVPGFATKVFMAALRSSLGNTGKLQWVATKDIGVVARLAFQSPERFQNRAIGLAGDSLTVPELCDKVEKKTNASIQPTFGILAFLLKKVAKELGLMVDWFGIGGFQADIPALKQLHPGLMDMETWLEKESTFPKKG